MAISASALIPPAQQSAAHSPKSSAPASPVAGAAFSVLEGLAFEASAGVFAVCGGGPAHFSFGADGAECAWERLGFSTPRGVVRTRLADHTRRAPPRRARARQSERRQDLHDFLRSLQARPSTPLDDQDAGRCSPLGRKPAGSSAATNGNVRWTSPGTLTAASDESRGRYQAETDLDRHLR
jgi:hypothetical protein